MAKSSGEGTAPCNPGILIFEEPVINMSHVRTLNTNKDQSSNQIIINECVTEK